MIWAANPGMQGGRALADIISGAAEPSGRLPISFARHVGQQPTYYNQIRGQHGDRYADLTQSPAWAFGEGLSYTTVEYSDLTLEATSLRESDTIVGHVTVSNTGERSVRETVQVYVRDSVTSVSWTDKELKAFRQVDLAPGESARVRVELPVADCTIVDAAGNRIVEAGALRAARRSQLPRRGSPLRGLRGRLTCRSPAPPRPTPLAETHCRRRIRRWVWGASVGLGDSDAATRGFSPAGAGGRRPGCPGRRRG